MHAGQLRSHLLRQPEQPRLLQRRHGHVGATDSAPFRRRQSQIHDLRDDRGRRKNREQGDHVGESFMKAGLLWRGRVRVALPEAVQQRMSGLMRDDFV